jgi:hypothetical protein
MFEDWEYLHIEELFFCDEQSYKIKRLLDSRKGIGMG